jgi:hypothetical protein
MVLPTGTTLSETKVSLICDLIRLVVENSALVHERMERRELAAAR